MVFTLSSLYVCNSSRSSGPANPWGKKKRKKYMLAMGNLTINHISILFLLPVVLVFPINKYSYFNTCQTLAEVICYISALILLHNSSTDQNEIYTIIHIYF